MNDVLMQSVKNQSFLFSIDPRTKLFLLIVTNAVLFGVKELYAMIIVAAIPIILLFTAKKSKAAFLCAVLYTFATYCNFYLLATTHGIVNILVVMVCGLVCRMMPGFVMGYYLVSTTTVSEFVAAMERMHVSQKIIIPLSVMFRFFPTVSEESRSINNAMRMRGVGFGSGGFFKNPMAMLEYRLVPLLMSTVKIGDELSAAALTRGLGGTMKRTNICKIGFGLQDIVLLCTAAGLLVSIVLL